MNEDKPTSKVDPLEARRKRVKRIKTTIIIIILLFLILPTILCVIMFGKIITLQKQIDVLMIDRYGVTYHAMNKKDHAGIAHAAVTDGTIIDANEKQEVSNLGNANQGNANLDNANEDNANQGSVTQKNYEQKDTTFEVTGQNTSKQILNNQKNAEQELASQEDAIPEKEEQEELDETASSKKVYLTFDDGPSMYTSEILDILSKYEAKATFFVIGKTDKYSKEMYKRIVEEGHTLGIHSYSHKYNKIYKSLEEFDKDFTKLSDLLYDTTGYIPTIYRFPGGSGNQVSKEDISNIITYLSDKSIVYFDWNVVNGDATGKLLTSEELYQNVMDGIDLHDTSIVLMHDTETKEKTVKSLENILIALKEQNVEILPLNNTVSPIQQVRVDSVK